MALDLGSRKRLLPLAGALAFTAVSAAAMLCYLFADAGLRHVAGHRAALAHDVSRLGFPLSALLALAGCGLVVGAVCRCGRHEATVWQQLKLPAVIFLVGWLGHCALFGMVMIAMTFQDPLWRFHLHSGELLIVAGVLMLIAAFMVFVPVVWLFGAIKLCLWWFKPPGGARFLDARTPEPHAIGGW